MSDFFSGNGIPSAPAKEPKQRKSKGAFLNWVTMNGSIIFIVILFIIAVTAIFLATFNITANFIKKALSATTVILAAVSYTLYLNGYYTGDNAAAQSEKVQSAETAYLKNISEIRAKKVEWQLNIFCSDYIQNELKTYKTEILLAGEFAPDEIEKILNGEIKPDELSLTAVQKKALLKARSAKPIKLNKSMIMSPSGIAAGRNPISSAAKINAYKYSRFILKFISVLLSAAFLVGIGVELITEFTVARLVACMVQLVLLCGSVFAGMRLGYLIRVRWTDRLKEITNVVGEFWEWLDHRPKIEP